MKAIFFSGGRSQDYLVGDAIMNGLIDSSTVLLPAKVRLVPCAGYTLASEVGIQSTGLPHLLPAPRMNRAAGESFIGSVNLRIPSNLYSAAATAGAVGTSPISPTPFAP